MFCGPCFLIMTRSRSLPMSSVSPFSIVVWFATPRLSRSVSGSKPSDMALPNLRANASRSPPFRMYSATYSASSMSLTTRYVSASDFVAIVSSCEYLPWMMTVWPFSLVFSTEVQTLDTQGQVVSTICTFLSFRRAISSTEAPKAGKSTTSPSCTTEKSLVPSSRTGTKPTPMSLRFLFTDWLWMISLVPQIFLSGKKLRAS
mmetsp:Transcript_61761/g.159336  ORF Transcript_61761/g.159336 Transcript_61761/m.159336 type:complete len:202 (+) Transcript_61761:59-664(+)